MFDHFLESSRWDDSNKWSNIGFGQEIYILEMKIRTLSGALEVNLEPMQSVYDYTANMRYNNYSKDLSSVIFYIK